MSLPANGAGALQAELRAGGEGTPSTNYAASGIGSDHRHVNSVPNEYSITKFLEKKAPRRGQVVEDRSGSTTAKFPAQIQHGDPRDKRYALLQSAISGDGMTLPGFGQYQASDRDLDYLQTKLEDAKNAKFKAWLYSQVDLKDPVYQKFWQEKLPGLYQERMKLIEDQIDLHTQLAKINLRGPESIEDFMLLYGIDTGEIPIPQLPFFLPEGVPKNKFNRGLFNVNNWFTDFKREPGIGWNDPLKGWSPIRSDGTSVRGKADMVTGWTGFAQ